MCFFISIVFFLTFVNSCKMGLVDQMTAIVFHQSYVTQRQFLLKLIISLAIVISVILISTDNWLGFCMMVFRIASVY